MKPSTNGKRVVAAVHAAPVFMDVDATIDKAIRFIEEAGKKGVELLVFPEVFVPGFPFFIMCYPPMDTIGANVEYVDASIEVPGPEIARVQAAAKKASVAVVLGISERLAGDRTCFNSLVFVDSDGTILGVHRKLQPSYMERMLWGQGGGATLKVFDAKVGRIGGLCCWEHTMNLARQDLIMQREQIHAAAWPAIAFNSKGSDEPPMVSHAQIEAMIKNHALTGQCFVISAGLIIDQTCLDWMEEKLGPQKYAILGGGWSAIVHPLTHFLAGPQEGLEDRLVTAEINLDDIKFLKIWCDGAGHYSRPEVLRLQVDRRPLWHDECASTQKPPACKDEGASKHEEESKQCSS